MYLYAVNPNQSRPMKKYLAFCSVIISLLSVVSCSKMASEDPADAFVGEYNVSVVENVVWGSDSGTINDNGVIYIYKVSSDRIRVSGYIGTEGSVVGSSVYFEGTYSSDSSGHITTSFGVGILSGNVLTFTANQTGQLAYNGVMYPFRCTASFTAIKQN